MTEIGRRGFLGLLGGGVVAAAAGLELDPERALWVPGQKKLFLPPTTTLTTARTMDEAVSKGLVAVFPDGMKVVVRHDDTVASTQLGWPVASLRLAQEVRELERAGARVMQRADVW